MTEKSRTPAPKNRRPVVEQTADSVGLHRSLLRPLLRTTPEFFPHHTRRSHHVGQRLRGFQAGVNLQPLTLVHPSTLFPGHNSSCAFPFQDFHITMKL